MTEPTREGPTPSAATAAEERGGDPSARVPVERLLTDMLMPMLKSWLDENLPRIIERAVEREAERLARRTEQR